MKTTNFPAPKKASAKTPDQIKVFPPIVTQKKKPSAHIFVDGQNLFHAARNAFNYRQINYDIYELAKAACAAKGWELGQISFYTGMPSQEVSASLNEFWSKKLSVMGRQGIKTVTRPLKYRESLDIQPDGTYKTVQHAREKGIDVRIAVDMISAAHDPQCDAILLFSQDNDLREAFIGASDVAAKVGRVLSMACAFPSSPQASNNRGIAGVEWIPILKTMYDTCIDHRNYAKDSGAHKTIEKSAQHQEAISSARAERALIAVKSACHCENNTSKITAKIPV